MKTVYDALMYLSGWPLAVVLIAGGLYFTIRTRFLQLRMFAESISGWCLKNRAFPGEFPRSEL